MFVKENLPFRHSHVLSFPPLSKGCQTKPLTDKLEKKNTFLLNQMNCEVITKGKLGKEIFHIYIMFLDNIWEISLNDISLTLNLNGI